MNVDQQEPGIVEDLGSVASLYKTVFWMMGKRIKYGPKWEERLASEALERIREPEARDHRTAVHAN